MSMSARYNHNHHQHHNQHQHQHQHQQQQHQQQHQHQQHQQSQKDYFQPLHVDCSVEYELPECAKPPQGVKIEPLLMIHPCHFRNLERQRRRPFENNLPVGKQRAVVKRSRGAAAMAVPYPSAWESCRIAQQPPQNLMQDIPVYSCQALAAWGTRDCQQLVTQPLPCYEAV